MRTILTNLVQQQQLNGTKEVKKIKKFSFLFLDLSLIIICMIIPIIGIIHSKICTKQFSKLNKSFKYKVETCIIASQNDNKNGAFIISYLLIIAGYLMQ